MPNDSQETKIRILNAAEELFALQGYNGTSMRAITQKAQVSLALANYHFGSKRRLFIAVIERRTEPINEERMALLDALEEEIPDGPLPIDRVLEAYLRPFLGSKEADRDKARYFIKLISNPSSEGDGISEELWKDSFRNLVDRYMAAFARALPGLPERELHWRFFFMASLMITVFSQPDRLTLISDGSSDGNAAEEVLKRMVAFLKAGFESPTF